MLSCGNRLVECSERPAFATAVAVVSLGACLGAPAWADDAAAPAAVPTQPAVWTPKEIQFTYMGFTTHYTCDGLQSTIKEMLLQLGARKDDLKVIEEPCSGNPDRPNPFPGVRIKMNVLQPVRRLRARIPRPCRPIGRR